jgi:hypothetical protein
MRTCRPVSVAAEIADEARADSLIRGFFDYSNLYVSKQSSLRNGLVL